MRLICEREKLGPRWFVDASAVWTPTDEKFEEFWNNCREIYGLFETDGDKLLAAVYFEYLKPDVANVHVSIIDKVPLHEVVRFFCSLKATKRSHGVRIFTGWVLERNHFLAKMGRAAGFVPTGLKMDYGQSRGRVLRWIQVAAR